MVEPRNPYEMSDPVPSALVEEVLVALEAAGVPEESCDQIVKIIETWEARDKGDCAIELPPILVPHVLARKQLLQALREPRRDEEAQHSQAENLLCAWLRAAGDAELADAWEEAVEVQNWFYA